MLIHDGLALTCVMSIYISFMYMSILLCIEWRIQKKKRKKKKKKKKKTHKKKKNLHSQRDHDSLILTIIFASVVVSHF